jgi:hypothetical protein
MAVEKRIASMDSDVRPGARSIDRDDNPDAITGAPGSHPIGTGVGAAAAGAAGAAIGSIIPGFGTFVGGTVGVIVGALAGGLAGKGVAEAVNPTEEDAYWRSEYKNRPYYEGLGYDDYEPAYMYGYWGYGNYADGDWTEIEPELGRDWDRNRGRSTLTWDRAKDATRDAWERAKNKMSR